MCQRELNGIRNHRIARHTGAIRLPMSKVLRRGNVKLQSSLLFDCRTNQGVGDLVRTAEGALSGDLAGRRIEGMGFQMRSRGTCDHGVLLRGNGTGQRTKIGRAHV